MEQTQSAARRIFGYLPHGENLPAAVWDSRHRFVLGFLWVHAIGLPLFGLWRGVAPLYAVGEGVLVAGLALLAAWPRLGRKFRSATAALGAVLTSAILTQFSGGYIEAHFHYFVVVALIAIYQDWVPFLVAVGFVALDHGVIGTLAPQWVYNHADAVQHPWEWALIHAVLVLAECVMLLMLWKSAEQANDRTELVLRSASEGILGLDLQGRVTFANDSALRLLGRAEPEVLGSGLGQVMRFTAGSAPPATVATLGLAGMKEVAGHLALQTADGNDLPVDWSLTPIMENNILKGSVVTLINASARERAEEERAKRLRQGIELERLQEQDRFKTLFISTAAHELHTPLTPLRLNVYSLKEGHRGVLSADQLDSVHILERNIDRLGRLVEDILNAARIQADKLAVRKSPVELSQVCANAAASYQESARRGEVTLEVNAPEEVWVQGDASRLEQVFTNLVANALKFTPPQGRITVTVAHEGQEAVVRVKDTGIGIAPADQARLFQPFTQAHNPMEQTRVGTGLGLYICRGIAELHKGRITLESPGPNQGSTFTLRLPLMGAPDASGLGEHAPAGVDQGAGVERLGENAGHLVVGS
ncbi:MAG: sensor histidine kinase [Thermoplasmatota archaeon]